MTYSDAMNEAVLKRLRVLDAYAASLNLDEYDLDYLSEDIEQYWDAAGMSNYHGKPFGDYTPEELLASYVSLHAAVETCAEERDGHPGIVPEDDEELQEALRVARKG